MCHRFEPYLPVVMPSLLATASAKVDLSVYGMCGGLCISCALMTSGGFVDKEDKVSDHREGWKMIVMGGQTYMTCERLQRRRCQAFKTLVMYCSTLGPRCANIGGKFAVSAVLIP